MDPVSPSLLRANHFVMSEPFSWSTNLTKGRVAIGVKVDLGPFSMFDPITLQIVQQLPSPLQCLRWAASSLIMKSLHDEIFNGLSPRGKAPYAVHSILTFTDRVRKQFTIVTIHLHRYMSGKQEKIACHPWFKNLDAEHLPLFIHSAIL